MSMLRMISALNPWAESKQEANSTSSKPKFNAFTTSESQGLDRVYFKNNALSFFLTNTFAGEMTNQRVSAEECVANLRYGFHNDKDHDIYHKSKNNFEISHYHLLKDDNTLISPEEFKCILDNIMRAEKGFKFLAKMRNEPVIDTGNESLFVNKTVFLSEGDAAHLIKDYNTFYADATLTPEEKLKIATRIKAKLDDINHSVMVDIHEAGKSMLNAFFATLMSHYFKPLLVYNMGYGNKKIVWAVEIMSSALTGLLAGSPLSGALDLAIRNVMKPALLKIGIKPEFAENLAMACSTIANFTKNPWNIMQLAANAEAIKFGHDRAYDLIQHVLPKLRTSGTSRDDQEKSVVQTVAVSKDDTDNTMEKEGHGLRKRRGYACS